MQHLDTSGHEPLSHLQDDLIRAIRDAQQAIAALKAAEPERHEALRAVVRECLSVLWILLAEPLMRVAAGWTESGQFEELIGTRTRREAREALAMGMFLNIIEALPTMSIDPTRNVVSYLQTIARRGIFKENKQIYQSTPRQPIEQVDLPDPASLEIEEQLLRACHHQQCWDALREWMDTLSHENLLIFKSRWFVEPPVPYEDIAQLIGAGWTAAAARRRLSRMLGAAARWLRERGLLE